MNLPKANLEWLWERTCFATQHGSRAYGTNNEKSDVDIRGFCIPPEEYFFGFRHKFEQYQIQALDLDVVIFDIRKFFTLASACNPNAIEILFTDKVDHLITTPVSNTILSERDKFLSQKAKTTFSGYAIGQLRKLNKQFNGDGTYNAKDAMHLIRLMRMCKEIGETGKVNVKRQDKDELLSIRNGTWIFSDIIKYAEDLDSKLDSVYAKSSLPLEPDFAYLEQLLINTVKLNVT